MGPIGNLLEMMPGVGQQLGVPKVDEQSSTGSRRSSSR